MKVWTLSFAVAMVVAGAAQAIWGICNAALRHYTFPTGYRTPLMPVQDLGWHLFFVTVMISIGAIAAILWGAGPSTSVLGISVRVLVIAVPMFLLFGWISALIVFLTH